jgi:hypothetical protein
VAHTELEIDSSEVAGLAQSAERVGESGHPELAEEVDDLKAHGFSRADKPNEVERL